MIPPAGAWLEEPTHLATAAALTGVLGLLIGSFLAVVSVRAPLGDGFVSGRSHCMSCKAQLRLWELVPVLSWVSLRGRCAHCKARISPRYPLIETGAGIIGLWAAVTAQSWLGLVASAILGWQLLLIALIDGENFWLPDQLTWPLAVSGLAASWCLGGLWGLTAGLIGVGFGFCSLWLVGWLYKAVRKREGLGGGDPFLLAGAGAWVGWQGLPSVLLWASAVGLSLVLAVLAVRRRIDGADKLPFGVFLAVGIWLTWILGPLGL